MLVLASQLTYQSDLMRRPCHDTTTAQGRLVFHMFGALAEFERSLIRERTQAAGFTHQRSEVERYARSGNFRASSALR
jgi:hypothetical protein